MRNLSHLVLRILIAFFPATQFFPSSITLIQMKVIFHLLKTTLQLRWTVLEFQGPAISSTGILYLGPGLQNIIKTKANKIPWGWSEAPPRQARARAHTHTVRTPEECSARPSSWSQRFLWVIFKRDDGNIKTNRDLFQVANGTKVLLLHQRKFWQQTHHR